MLIHALRCLLPFGCLVLGGCRLAHPGSVARAPWPAPPAGETVVCSERTVIAPGFRPLTGQLSGNVWDLRDGTLDGRDAGPCNDDERGDHVIIRYPGLTIRNGRFANWPDGVQIDAPGVTFENVRFENCEDCLNVLRPVARDWTVRGCRFQASPLKCTHENDYWGDKAMQINAPAGSCLIEDCTFVDFQNAVRCGLDHSAPCDGVITCRGNIFFAVGTAYHVRSGTLAVDPSLDQLNETRQHWKTDNSGRIFVVKRD